MKNRKIVKSSGGAELKNRDGTLQIPAINLHKWTKVLVIERNGSLVCVKGKNFIGWIEEELLSDDTES